MFRFWLRPRRLSDLNSARNRRRLRYEALEPREMLTTFTVTNKDDSGGGSLRDAILDANAENGADKIVFADGLAGKTIKINSSLPAIADDLTIQAPKGKSKIVIDGQDAAGVRPLEVSAGVAVTLKKLTIQGGNLTGAVSGGGIINAGDLTLKNCVVRDNEAGNDGGGIHNSGTLSLNKVELTGNECADDGGGVYNGSAGTLQVTGSRILGNRSGSSGGGVYNLGTADIAKSTIAGNVALQGGGIDQTGGVAALVLRESTLYGNHSDNAGGGASMSNGITTIRNSTLAYNTAGGSGGGGGGAIYTTSPSVTIVNSTIVHNADASDAAQGAGGISKNGGTLILSNSIVALNSAGPSSANDNVDAADITTGTSNFIGGDPMLGPLQNNGGPTFSMAPLAGSPVIDGGNNSVATQTGQAGGTALTTDQLGNLRIFDGNANGASTVDQGAVEFASKVQTIQAQVAPKANERAAAPVDSAPAAVEFAAEFWQTAEQTRTRRTAEIVFGQWGQIALVE